MFIMTRNTLCACKGRSGDVGRCCGKGKLDSASVRSVSCGGRAGSLLVICGGYGVSVLRRNSMGGVPCLCAAASLESGSLGSIVVCGRCTCLSVRSNVMIIGVSGGRVASACGLSGGVASYTVFGGGVCTSAGRNRGSAVVCTSLGSGLLSKSG